MLLLILLVILKVLFIIGTTILFALVLLELEKEADK
jgi:flagellar basal body-associated protein FliL